MIFVSKEKGINQMKQNIIAGIVIIALVACFAIFNILTEKKPVEYFSVMGIKTTESALIDEYRVLKKITKDKQLKEDMSSSITYEKHNILEYFNEEYFKNKKVGMVVVYEDNTKDYEYSIDEVIYNEDKTEATIKYTYKVGTYLDTFVATWNTYMFVELEPTVENVKFVSNETEVK